MNNDFNNIIIDLNNVIYGYNFHSLITAFELTKNNETGIIIDNKNDNYLYEEFNIYINENSFYFLNLLDELNIDKKNIIENCNYNEYIISSLKENIIYNKPNLSIYNYKLYKYLNYFLKNNNYKIKNNLNNFNLTLDNFFESIYDNDNNKELFDLILKSKYNNGLKYAYFNSYYNFIYELLNKNNKYLISKENFNIIINNIKNRIKNNFKIYFNYKLIKLNKNDKSIELMDDINNNKILINYYNLILIKNLEFIIDKRLLIYNNFLVVSLIGLLNKNLIRLIKLNENYNNIFINFIINDINNYDNIKLISINLENELIKFNFELINNNNYDLNIINYIVKNYIDNNVSYEINNIVKLNNINPIIFDDNISYDSYSNYNIFINDGLNYNNIDNIIFSSKNLVNNFIIKDKNKINKFNNINNNINKKLKYNIISNNYLFFLILFIFIIIILIIIFILFYNLFINNIKNDYNLKSSINNLLKNE